MSNYVINHAQCDFPPILAFSLVVLLNNVTLFTVSWDGKTALTIQSAFRSLGCMLPAAGAVYASSKSIADAISGMWQWNEHAPHEQMFSVSRSVVESNSL